jgi:hypothetical protein
MSLNPKVCIIRNVNDLNEKHAGIDDCNWNEKDLSHYNLKEKIEEYVDFIEILSIPDLFNLISCIIQPSDKYVINIDDFYYNSEYVYQAVFKLPDHNNTTYNTQLEECNKLGTQLLTEKFIVNGNMIIIKRSIKNDKYEYVDMTMDDVTDILRSQFLHKAIIVKPNNQLVEATYIYNALEINFNQSHLDNSRFFEHRFLDYRLFFHIDKNAVIEENNLNKFASMIYGKKIYGNVLISLCDNSDDSPKPLDITADIITQIYYLSLNQRHTNEEIDRKKYSRNLNIDKKEFNDTYTSDKFEHENFPEIILCPNFYYVINNEYKILNIDELKFYENNINFDLVLNDIE